MNVAMEHPQTTIKAGIAASAGTVVLVDALLYDWYSPCGWIVSAGRLVFTLTIGVALPAAVLMVNWGSMVTLGLEIAIKLGTLCVTAFTAYGLYKKNVRVRRRRKINKVRKQSEE